MDTKRDENNRKIGYQVRSLERAIHRRHCQSSTKSYVDRVTGTRGWVIGYLYDNRDKDIFQRDIEKTFGIRRSSVTSLLQLLEQNGLIIRTPVKQDARLKKITLTDEALRLHDMISQDIDDIEEKMVQGLSDEEITAFISTIEKLFFNRINKFTVA